ncbi:hypothetical protein RUND412_008671 [Rhizina undulata]
MSTSIEKKEGETISQKEKDATSKKSSEKKKIRKAVILDAGSSGTRIYVYEWVERDGNIPWSIQLPDSWDNKKSFRNRGIDKFIPKSNTAADIKENTDSLIGYFNYLLEYAKPHLAGATDPIPLFILATGGMRKLRDINPKEYKKLNITINKVIRQVTTSLDLEFEEIVFQTISGEDEALFGWVAVNFNKFHFQDKNPTHGFMEIGGQSAQIAYSPNLETDVVDYEGPLTRVQIGDKPYDVFVRTWPALGANAVWRLHEQDLVRSRAKEDPCLPKGYHHQIRDENGTLKACVFGTGNLEECETEIKSFICCNEDCKPTDDACAGAGRGCLLEDAPSLGFGDASRQFLGTSVYWYAINFALGASKIDREESYNMNAIQGKLEEFSNPTWETTLQTYKTAWGNVRDLEERKEHLSKVIYKAKLVTTILHYGFGLPENEGSFKTVKGATWTLGRIVLYATGDHERKVRTWDCWPDEDETK